MNPVNDIDTNRLANELKRFRQRQEMTMNNFGYPEFQNTTLSRIERTVGVPNTDTLVVLARKLNQPLAAFFGANAGKVIHYPDASLIDRISAVLYTDKSLSYAAKNALVDLMSAAIEETAHA